MKAIKIPLHLAMAMYEEEKDFICPEEQERRITSEIEACYEQFAKEEAQRIDYETDISWYEFEDFLWWDTMFEDENEQDCIDAFYHDESEELPCEEQKKPRNRAYRRKQNKRCKNKLIRNTIDALNSFDKRIYEDMKNKSFCKRRAGRWIELPKHKSVKTEKLWARTAKMHLLEV